MAGTCTAVRLLPVLMVALALQWSGHFAAAQRSTFSLQAAVDELHRREAAKYPLNAPPSPQHFLGTDTDADYWVEDTDYPAKPASKSHNRHRLNKALAKYLERENYEAEHGGLSLGSFGLYEFDDINNSNNYNADDAHDAGQNRLGGVGGVGNKARNKFLSNFYNDDTKRSPSVFRERDNKYDDVPASVFRERESESPKAPEPSELAEHFLRAIEESQEREREENYKEALRNLWEKYQRQENEINDDELFEEKKRIRTPPYYMLMAKKRSYPVLPWLPYSADRKKRFPVSKRSTAENSNFGKTDEKVARELKELFGEPIEEKRKRSTDGQAKATSTDMPSTAMTEMRLEMPKKKSNDSSEGQVASTVATHEHEHTHEHTHDHEHEHGQHSQKEHKHRKRSEGDHDDSYEDEEEDSDETEGHEEHEEEEDDHDDFDDDDEEHKKKRSIGLKKRSPRFELNARRKKSIEWSKYFGIDRKKKAYRTNKSDLDMKKRNADRDEDDTKRKRDIDPEQLENMDKKLHSIEDFIIDETIKYTGAHEGINKPEEIRRLKDRVLSRLATAYSLEKMRRALEKLRQSVEHENHLLRNMIESEGHTDADDADIVANEKRLSVKKETAEQQHDNDQVSADAKKSKEMHSNAVAVDQAKDDDDDDSDDRVDIMKKKKKRNGYIRYPELPNEFADAEEELGAGHYESLNDAYLGNKNYMLGSNQCPLIEAMADRCRGVDLLSGDLNQELLPICGVHQICYLCGTSQVSCDYQYLTDADAICGPNKDCQAAARSVLMILRGNPGPQLGPRECLKKPCLYSVMREIGM